ncbi:MAG TPA: hypothetical protein VGE72_23830 [Azospirillum sp.]
MLKQDGRTQNGRTMVEHLLDDPIVDLLLARDGLTRADVRRVMETARRSRRARMAEPVLEPRLDRAA